MQRKCRKLNRHLTHYRVEAEHAFRELKQNQSYGDFVAIHICCDHKFLHLCVVDKTLFSSEFSFSFHFTTYISIGFIFLFWEDPCFFVNCNRKTKCNPRYRPSFRKCLVGDALAHLVQDFGTQIKLIA